MAWSVQCAKQKLNDIISTVRKIQINENDITSTVRYIDTTKTTRAPLPQQDKTTELQSFKISTGLNKHINLINIYIPPIDSVPSGYLPPLHQITQLPDLIIGGDFNGKSTAWKKNNITNTRGACIKHELQHQIHIQRLNRIHT